MRSITILCDGGLGNRLNSLIGGLITAEIINAVPIISWPENNWCGCSFDDLYTTENTVNSDNILEVFYNNKESIFLIHENQIKASDLQIYSHTTSNVLQITSMKENVVYYHSTIPEYISNDKVISMLKNLTIKSDILTKVKEYCDKYNINNSTKGILFRKTDYASNPSISLDVDQAISYINSNKDSHYYICSDDRSVEETLKELSNVYVYPKTSYVEKFKEGSWNEYITDNEGRSSNFNVKRPKQSVIEAFIGLLILSKTEIIIDVPSTFLDYAKLYNKIKLY